MMGRLLRRWADPIVRRQLVRALAARDAARAEVRRLEKRLAAGARLLPPDTDTRTETATIFGGATSQRTVRTFADGSTLTGPWRPVPSTPTKES